ncbi:MAG: hypothetical protein QW275_02235, partial [Candidatus Anstonellaceae archaeon]
MARVGGLLPFFFALISVVPSINAAEACSVSTLDTEGAMSFIVVAMALVSTAIALVYMYSKLKEDSNASVWAKDEAGNLIITVLMFVGLVVFFQTSCELSKAFTKGKPPIDAAISYLDRL